MGKQPRLGSDSQILMVGEVPFTAEIVDTHHRDDRLGTDAKDVLPSLHVP